MEDLGEEDFFPGNYAKQVELLTSLLDFNADEGQRNQRSKDIERGMFINKRPRHELENSQIVSFDLSLPQFPLDINNIQPIDTRKGNKFDINSLFISGDLIRNNNSGDVVDVRNELEGKYVMICCFHVPVYRFGLYSNTALDLSLISKELSSRTDFEMVLVVKMRPNWVHDQDAFRHFLSGFSESCLVVPFERTTRIDYICRSINLKNVVSAIVVGPDGVVVQDKVNKIVLTTFPFTGDITMTSCWRNQTLNQLLGDSCSVLYRNRPGIGPVSVSVSELEKKEVVGLYLCGEGYDIPLFDRVYNGCRAKQLEFEMVLVYTPFVDHHSPEVLEQAIGSFLDKSKISWWVFPFSYFICRRLFDLVSGLCSDKLLILSRGELVEADGEVLVRCFGCDGYPFRRESIIERGLEKIKEHTLESLLAGGSLRRGNNPTDQVSVAHLRGRKVIVFLGRGKSMDFSKLIEKHYYDIKKKDACFEVVFVNTDEKSSPSGEEKVFPTPWLVFHPGTSQSQSVVEALSLWGRRPVCNLFAFGEDGQICSVNAQSLLRCYGSKGFPFCGDLRQELAFWLEGRLMRHTF